MTALAQVNTDFDREFGESLARIPTPVCSSELDDEPMDALDRYDAGIEQYLADNLTARKSAYWLDIGQMQMATEEVASQNATALVLIRAIQSADFTEAGRVLNSLLRAEIARRAEQSLCDEFAP